MAERVYTCGDHNDRATFGRIADTKEKLQKTLTEATRHFSSGAILMPWRFY